MPIYNLLWSILFLRTKYANFVMCITFGVFYNTSSPHDIISLVAVTFLPPHAERPDTIHYFKPVLYNPLEGGKLELAFLPALHHIFPILLTLVHYREVFPPDSWGACIGFFPNKRALQEECLLWKTGNTK